jgi:hypothetical protein
MEYTNQYDRMSSFKPDFQQWIILL